MARLIIFGEFEGVEEGRWFEGRKGKEKIYERTFSEESK